MRVSQKLLHMATRLKACLSCYTLLNRSVYEVIDVDYPGQVSSGDKSKQALKGPYKALQGPYKALKGPYKAL